MKFEETRPCILVAPVLVAFFVVRALVVRHFERKTSHEDRLDALVLGIVRVAAVLLLLDGSQLFLQWRGSHAQLRVAS